VLEAAALGMALFVLPFFEPLPLVLGLFFALLVVRSLWLGQISRFRLLIQMCVAIVAFLAVYGIVRLVLGFNLMATFARIAEHARRFNEDTGRPYAIWVWTNLRDFFFGIGICQAVVFCVAFVDGFRGGDFSREALTRPITVLCIGAAAVLVAIVANVSLPDPDGVCVRPSRHASGADAGNGGHRAAGSDRSRDDRLHSAVRG